MNTPDNISAKLETTEDGLIAGCVKDGQSITSDWEFHRPLIEGVGVQEIKSVPKENGVLTEIYRRDWGVDEKEVGQIFQVQLVPGGITAWHVHQYTTDRLFVSQGSMKIVLFDARSNSPTLGMINEFRFGTMRCGLISIPPGVWHGVQNNAKDTAILINIVDRAYNYEDPDHWRLPCDTPKIPYSFKASKEL
jgi:dTDP-4-dehydrorhamnose 3,5-epimerase